MMCITNNCSKEILVAIMHLPDAKTIWNYLYATYSGVNVQRKFEGIEAKKSILNFPHEKTSPKTASDFEKWNKIVSFQ
jgi:hypothetical protein